MSRPREDSCTLDQQQSRIPSSVGYSQYIKGSWVKLKKADPKQLPVLDVRQLSPRQRRSLSYLFDEMTNADFRRLPAMQHCPARRHLDESLANILNLPTLTTLRHLVATAPTISYNPR